MDGQAEVAVGVSSLLVMPGYLFAELRYWQGFKRLSDSSITSHVDLIIQTHALLGEVLVFLAVLTLAGGCAGHSVVATVNAHRLSGHVDGDLVLGGGSSRSGILKFIAILKEEGLVGRCLAVRLDDVVVLSIHDYVKAEVFVSVHACSEQSLVHRHFGLREVLLGDVIALTLHRNVETKIFIACHSICEECSWLLTRDTDVSLRNMILLAFHDDIKAQVLVTAHSLGKGLARPLDPGLRQVLLRYMEVLPFHCDVHSQILASFHAVSEQHGCAWDSLGNLLLDDAVLLCLLVEPVVLALECLVLVLHSL